ncbi:Uncharacterised protein [Bordetella pertussis]|nr:Uncharacterised protein [Bordetella pertussis]
MFDSRVRKAGQSLAISRSCASRARRERGAPWAPVSR